MSDLKEVVLKVVDVEGKASSIDLAARLKVTHNEIVGVIKSLQAIDAELLSVSDRKIVKFVPTEEGECGQASMCCVWRSLVMPSYDQLLNDCSFSICTAIPVSRDTGSEAVSCWSLVRYDAERLTLFLSLQESRLPSTARVKHECLEWSLPKESRK